MAKHILHDAVFVEREVELPEKCPHCEADLTESHSINEWNWVDCKVESHVEIPEGPAEPSLEPEGYTETGETYHPSALWCTACDREIASGANVVLQSSNPRAAAIRDVIALEE